MGDIFAKKKATYEAGITIDRDEPYIINNNDDYSPTNKSFFCLLKL